MKGIILKKITVDDIKSERKHLQQIKTEQQHELDVLSSKVSFGLFAVISAIRLISFAYKPNNILLVFVWVLASLSVISSVFSYRSSIRQIDKAVLVYTSHLKNTSIDANALYSDIEEDSKKIQRSTVFMYITWGLSVMVVTIIFIFEYLHTIN